MTRMGTNSPSNHPGRAKLVDAGVDVVMGRHRVEDEIEAVGGLAHRVGIERDTDFVGANAEDVVLFAGCSSENNDTGSERTGNSLT